MHIFILYVQNNFCSEENLVVKLFKGCVLIIDYFPNVYIEFLHDLTFFNQRYNIIL